MEKEKQKTHVLRKQQWYPIATDNHRQNWNAWGNDIWPSVYLIDKEGYVRYWWYGELNWNDAHQEKVAHQRILELMAE